MTTTTTASDTHTHIRTEVFTKQVFVAPPPTTLSSFIWSKAKKRRRASLLVGTIQALHASAITIKEEQINFGYVLLCSGHGLFEYNQGKCAQQQCRHEKKDTHCEKRRMANLGLNTMVTGHIELIVIF